MISMKKSVLSAAVVLAFGASAAQAAYTPIVTTTGNNFTMVSASNGLTGGTNDVTFTWDGTVRSSVVMDGSYNATLSSPTAFSGKKWTAHHVNLYSTGTYVFDTTCASGGVASTTYNPACGSGTAAQKITLTVGVGQVGAHMLFNWSTSSDIDVVVLWDTYGSTQKSWASTGTTSAFCAGNPGTANCATGTGNNINTLWDGVSIDTPASTLAPGATADETNNYSGTKMIDGPFVGQSANFNVQGVHAVPVPAAAWLLGSGLLGLVGVARRRKAA